MSNSINDIAKHIEIINNYNSRSKMIVIYKSENDYIQNLQTMIKHYWHDKWVLNILPILWPGDSTFEGFYYNPFLNWENNGTIYSFKSYDEFELVNNPFITYNLHGHPVRVHSFTTQLNLPVYLEDLSGFIEYEVNILEILSKLMNFTIQYYNRSDDLHFGEMLAKDIYTGALYVLENNLADMAITEQRFKDFYSKNIIFYFPTQDVKFQFVVPKNYHPRQVDVFFIFNYDTEAQIYFGITCVLLVLLLSITNKLINKQNNLMMYIMLMVSLLCSVSFSQISRVPQNERSILIWVLFMALLITTIYQGNIIDDLNSATRFDIYTIEDLVSTNLPIYVPKFVKDDFSAKCNDSLFYQLHLLCDRIIEVDSDVELSLEKISVERNAAVLTQMDKAKLYRALLIDKNTGVDTIFIVPYIVHTALESFLSQKRSPYYKRMNFLVQRLLETGMFARNEMLMQRQIDQIRLNIGARAPNERDAGENEPLLLFEFLTAIYILLILYGIAILIFCVELLWARSSKHDMEINISFKKKKRIKNNKQITTKNVEYFEKYIE